jgi:predicted enzyme related to lactoylglutathione lyase
MTLSNTPGAPCWIELFTPDAQKSASFYGGLFGWTADEPQEEYGGYMLLRHNGEPVAGCMRNDGTMGGHNAWSVYLESDDIDATVKKAQAAGGQVVMEPVQVGPLGHMAFVVDPAGASVGVWQPLEHQGFAARAEVGAPAWFETLSTDYEKSLAFYRDAFDWELSTMSDTPEFRYTTLGEGEGAMAGIMDAAGFLQGAPSAWQFYIEVADTDATVEQTLAAGGSQVMPADDSPYGRLALLEDPAGVRFAVMGPSAATAE